MQLELIEKSLLLANTVIDAAAKQVDFALGASRRWWQLGFDRVDAPSGDDAGPATPDPRKHYLQETLVGFAEVLTQARIDVSRAAMEQVRAAAGVARVVLDQTQEPVSPDVLADPAMPDGKTGARGSTPESREKTQAATRRKASAPRRNLR